MLTITEATKYYGQQAILNNISLTLQKNTIIGLAGPSGSGKSTLLRCLQKLESLDAGKIQHAGTTGFMFQDFQLFPHMTVLQNVVYAAKIHLQDPELTPKALSLLAQLGIADKAEYYPSELSGGQKQRAALARSLMMQPNYLLCDEPTSGLDVAIIRDVVILLQSIHDTGVSMIIASHDLDFLTQIASRIIVLKKGVIAADVDVASLDNPIDTLKSYYVQ